MRGFAANSTCSKCFSSLFPWAQLGGNCTLIESRKLNSRNICGLIFIDRIVYIRSKSKSLMFKNTCYSLSMIQFGIFSWLYRRLLTSKLNHPLAVLSVDLGILFLALGMSSETYNLLAENFQTILTFLLVTPALFILLSQKFKLLLLILLIGVRLVYSDDLLLLCLSQCHQPPSILIILRRKLPLFLWAWRP